MHRLRYFLHRLLRLDLANMWRLAGLITAEYRTPRILVMLDMAQCAVRYYAGYHDYHEWDWHLLRAAERRTYLTRPQAHQLTRALNDPRHAVEFTDKVRFNDRFARFLGRDWLDLRECDGESLARFVREHGTVVVKALAGMGGDGVGLLDLEEIDRSGDPETLRGALLAAGRPLVEERIAQHPDLAALHPASLNTIRVVSYFDGDRVRILARSLKIGNGEPVDNFGRSGMQTILEDDGTARYGAFDKEGGKFTVHPVTGVAIPGTRVPHWDRVLRLVDEAARVVPQVPYVGWDIAVTPAGPVLVEGNYDSGVFQMKPSMSGVRRGLRGGYLDAIGTSAGLRARLPRSAKLPVRHQPSPHARA